MKAIFDGAVMNKEPEVLPSGNLLLFVTLNDGSLCHVEVTKDNMFVNAYFSEKAE